MKLKTKTKQETRPTQKFETNERIHDFDFVFNSKSFHVSRPFQLTDDVEHFPSPKSWNLAFVYSKAENNDVDAARRSFKTILSPQEYVWRHHVSEDKVDELEDGAMGSFERLLISVALREICWTFRLFSSFILRVDAIHLNLKIIHEVSLNLKSIKKGFNFLLRRPRHLQQGSKWDGRDIYKLHCRSKLCD